MADHRDVQRALSRVATGLAAVGAHADPAPEASARAVRALEDLDALLAAHFNEEEAADGFFAEILATAPHRATAVEASRREHPELAKRMGAVAEAARWAGLSSEAWQRVRRSFEDLLAALERHEASENALLSEELLRDEGGRG